MIKELRLAAGRGDAKAHGQMEKKPDRARTERNRKRKSLIRCLFTVFVEKKMMLMMMCRLGSGINATGLVMCGLLIQTTNSTVTANLVSRDF